MLFLMFLVLVVVAMAVRGVLVMLLWNWLLPSILGLPEISFLEGIGLYLLTSVLFGTLVDKNLLPAKSKKKE